MGLNRLKKDLNIILELSLKNIRLEYNNSIFGYIWMLINPILMMITLYVVFSIVMNINLPNYQLFLLLGIIIWNFFVESTTKSIQSIINNISLLKKVKIPLYTLIISSNISSLINFFFSLIVLIGMMIFFNIRIFTLLRLTSIFYIFLLFIISTSISIIISIIYLYFKDFKHVWNFVLLIGFWVTPIIYVESSIPNEFLKYYMLNPIGRIISHMRNSLIYNYTDSFFQIIITLAITSILFFLGIMAYNLFSKKIYDLL